ncbi:hypothetical protein C3942_12150 [Solimonas fluminis]|uniref:DUF4345 domain-containing protein n=1 Tax=Solimonas fluminis TaxID=2086571 RepID=A0A2S5TEZ7_9GAMM|nr:hypothetical protein [Solimonas fluminis]PPE73549.1 hypothetical protein C3942_12150 [Solimonas fluminis]
MTPHPIPPRTVRFWAGLDAGIAWMAIPPLAPKFLAMIYWLNGLLGGDAAAPPLDQPMHLLFVCLTGALVGTWALARLLHPVGLLGVIDGWARLYVAAVLAWVILGLDGPPILWLFVLTETAGTLSQLRAAYARPDA